MTAVATIRLALGAAALVAGMILGSACGGTPGGSPQADGGRSFPHPSRVAVMVLENRSYGQVIGSSRAPYINRLARRYALATRYYAITHPSLPNYIALTGGSVSEIKRNCSRCDTPGINVVGQLEKAGLSWKAYFEELGSNRRPGAITQEYNPHYNPFVYYESVRNTPRSHSRVVGFDNLPRDLRHMRLPRFSWIAPGVLHDGHNSSLREADRYAGRLVRQVLRALGPTGVLYLTWDEGAGSDVRGVGGGTGGGRVALIAAGGGARPRTRLAVEANHYALLRTIQANFDLPALGKSSAQSTPLLGGLLKGG